MDFDSAIRAHSGWKLRLANYLKDPDGSINAENLSKDSLCDLGKWLYGDGQQFKDESQFQELVAAHAVFHKEASKIVVKKDNGESIGEDTALGSVSDYGRASMTVITILMKMKSAAKG